jgi:hypothetical protein
MATVRKLVKIDKQTARVLPETWLPLHPREGVKNFISMKTVIIRKVRKPALPVFKQNYITVYIRRNR